jgi:hypothetical protein
MTFAWSKNKCMWAKVGGRREWGRKRRDKNKENVEAL